MSGQLGVGRVLATACRLWLRNLPRILVIAGLLYAPHIAWTLGSGSDALQPVLELYYRFTLDLHPILRGAVDGDVVLYALITAAMTHAVFVARSGKPAPIGRAVMTALRRFLPVLGVALVVEAAAFGTVAAVLWVVLWQLPSPWAVELVPFAGWLGYTALRSMLFYLAVPVATAERRGVVGSIVRGFQLARGARLRVLAIAAIASFVLWGGHRLLALAVLPDPLASGAAYGEAWQLYAYLRTGMQVVVVPLSLVIAAVTYWLLREAKEDPEPDELARVFE